MKSQFVYLFLFIMGSITVSCGQSSPKVPMVVQQAFAAKFTTASKVKWHLEDESQWEAEFYQNDQEMSANFKLNGQWQETEVELESDQVPSMIMESIRTNYPDMRIKEVAQLQRPDTSDVYEIELKKGKKILEVLLDEHGTVISEKEEDGGRG